MKFALFVGCNIPSRVSQYGEATAAVFSRFSAIIPSTGSGAVAVTGGGISVCWDG